MRGPTAEGLPSRATVHRILVRQGLVVPRARRRKRSDYVRWQRPAPMQLWQLDLVYGPWLVDTATGELREARIVTGVDDHSRFCVLARVVDGVGLAPRRRADAQDTQALDRHAATRTPARSARRSHGRIGPGIRPTRDGLEPDKRLRKWRRV
jgi:hypothetical protein